jgi:hypothetical protein
MANFVILISIYNPQSSLSSQFLHTTKNSEIFSKQESEPLMDPQDVINLFDSYWFNLEIFTKPSFSSRSSCFESNPFQEIHKDEAKDSDSSMISKLPSILVRTKSDQISSTGSLFSDSNSPNSVLFTPNSQVQEESKQIEETQPVIKSSMKGKIGKKKLSSSKSLSELEIEELKGFMDLGFVFSEEDKDSSLVEIIPGLQRLGKKTEHHQNLVKESSHSCSSVSRPYLSEAWEVLDRKNREIQLLNWNLAMNDENDIKKNLKLWAHNVAAVVIR